MCTGIVLQRHREVALGTPACHLSGSPPFNRGSEGLIGPSILFDAVRAILGRRGSPLSQKVTLRAVRGARGRSLRDVLRADFRIVCRMVEGPSDFEEVKCCPLPPRSVVVCTSSRDESASAG